MRSNLRAGLKKIAIVSAMAYIILVGKEVRAAETTTLRVISTTDIHNQITSEDYDVAGKNNAHSLSRLSTMIKAAKAEMTEGDSITVDVGDSVYGYGSETIMGSFENPNNNLQPIFNAMSKIGYDAITLGNHEFDYGYEFIKKQMSASGLESRCLVANVKDLSTNTYPWKRTMMITKNMKTSNGSNVTIKVGVVGVTKAELSTYYDYNGILQGESMLRTVREQSAALKKAGANVVVVLAHCGMGDESSDDSAQDPGYAMSKLPNVDCVMLGHQHRNYPSNDTSTQLFYKLANTDKETGLTNGKPVVMVADHAAGIGVADLKLKISGSSVSVTGASAEVRPCTALVREDTNITNAVASSESVIQQTYKESIATVASSSAITGFFGPIEDNYAIQLNNESKIRFGLRYSHSSAGSAYSKYHVIAGTKFYLDGSEGKDDYMNIGENFTMKDILNTQDYQHDNNYVYWITGEQLRTWLEWSSSIFAQTDETISSDYVLSKLMKEKNASSVVANSWLNNWSAYQIFDGIEYEIDASQPPRYKADGTVINPSSSRITKLTYDGKNVGNSAKFLFVGNYISANKAVMNALYNQRLTSKENRTVYYFKNYVKELGQFGALTDKRDNNWSVSFGSEKQIMRSSSLSEMYAAMQPWYKKTLKTTENYAYYLADLSEGTNKTDTSGPLVVLSPSTTVTTNKNVLVSIQASDASGVTKIAYLNGQYDETSSKWSQAPTISNSALNVSTNGTYSICAYDSKGNKTVKNINISNINTNVLEIPTVDKFTNRMTYVTGETQSGLTVHVIAGGNTYNTTAASSGKYSCKVAAQKAGSTVYVYVTDSHGRSSSKVSTKVLRRGPNTPTLKAVTNKTETLKGSINDTNSTVIVYVGSTVYVPKQKGAAIYKACNRYDKKRTIKTATSYKVTNGSYAIKIPSPAAKKVVKVFAVDSQNRTSLIRQRTTTTSAPNQPKVNTICDAEKYVTGKIPSSKKVCNVTVKVGKRKYKAKSTKKGSFVVKTKSLKKGTKVYVSASDKSKGKTRTSAKAVATVGAKEQYITSAGKSKISVKKVTSKSKVIKGKVSSSSQVFINFGSTSAQLSLNKNGTFSYTLPRKLAGGSTIYVATHNKSTGNIEEVKKVTVNAVKPSKPSIVKSTAKKKSKKILVLAKEKATLVAKVKGKSITVNKCSYNKKRKAYVYSVPVSKGSGKISCYVKNSAGKSKSTSVKRK